MGAHDTSDVRAMQAAPVCLKAVKPMLPIVMGVQPA